MNVLIVEDEFIIARNIKKVCEGIPGINTVDIALNYEDAMVKASSSAFDVYLTDIFLGDRHDGLEFCQHLRTRQPQVPIIVLTSAYSLEFLEQAFSLGVNDYILKPFHPRELELRIQRWMVSSRNPSLSKISYDRLSYCPESHEFFFDQRKLNLTKREKALMLIFIRDSEKLIPTELMKEKFWGDYSEKNRNIRSSIQGLRRSVGDPCSAWIRTVRGEGYILKKDNC